MKSIRPEDPIKPGEYGADVVRRIIGKEAVVELLLCSLCRLLGKETCPHRVARETSPPEEAKRCTAFEIAADTYADAEVIFLRHVKAA